ncbi:antifreeze protein [Ochrobactrum sp. CM-21-5]|nr:antifreeze protein [Ochrobactrum sp. CM-21-5]MBC2884775.1 antifreeze protein [Ochrobactrum sp. CM-21-5]
MSIRTITAVAGTAIIMGAAAFAFSSPASALTMKECSAKYQSAKDAGTLGNMKWNDFRKAQCGDDAAAAPAAAPAPKKAAKKSENAASGDDSAKGLSMKECSAKYQAAKDAGTLGGVKWNDFRKTQCGADAAAAPAAAPAKKAAKKSAASTAASAGDGAKGLSMKECSAKYQAAKDAGSDNGLKWNNFRKAECGPGADPVALSTDGASEPQAPTTVAPRGVKFPTAVSSKFSSETPGKARMHTCLEQYYAAKEANALGGLKWIQKGGGYYSLCNARLKGNS